MAEVVVKNFIDHKFVHKNLGKNFVVNGKLYDKERCY